MRLLLKVVNQIIVLTLNRIGLLTSLVALFIYCANAHAQQPYFRELGISSGVPSINIYDLFVASDGLLYLGTDKGLFNYDGIKFRKLEFVESLAVGVNGIHEDKQGRIWCKNFSSQIN